MRVAAGAVARKVIPGVTIRGALVQIGPHKIDRARWNWDEVDNNPFFSPDPGIVDTWSNYLDGTAQGRLLGGRRDRGGGRRRAGRLGRADLRQARPGPGRRHDEHQCGEGRRDRRRHGGGRADRRGQRRRDPHRQRRQRRCSCPTTPAASSAASRRAADRGAASPSSRPRRSSRRGAPSTASATDTEISTKGRHDPCVGIRAVPVGEAMMAIVLADHFLRHRAQIGSSDVSGRRSISRRLAETRALQLSRRSGGAAVSRRQGAASCSTACACCARASPGSSSSATATAAFRLCHRAVAARPGAVPPLRPRHRRLRNQPACSSTAAPTASSTASPSSGARLGGVWRLLAAAALRAAPDRRLALRPHRAQPLSLVRPHRALHDAAARVARALHRVRTGRPWPPRTTCKALLFDVFGTVVDWRSSIIADLTALRRQEGHQGRLGRLHRRLARPLSAGHGGGALRPPRLDHPRRAAPREPGHAARQVRHRRAERGRQGPHQPRLASAEALARRGGGPDAAQVALHHRHAVERQRRPAHAHGQERRPAVGRGAGRGDGARLQAAAAGLSRQRRAAQPQARRR